MNVSDFSYQLPEELIAQFPPENRGDSRLLKVMQGRALEEGIFSSIIDEFRTGDLLVLNDTKVIPARRERLLHASRIPSKSSSSTPSLGSSKATRERVLQPGPLRAKYKHPPPDRCGADLLGDVEILDVFNAQRHAAYRSRPSECRKVFQPQSPRTE